LLFALLAWAASFSKLALQFPFSSASPQWGFYGSILSEQDPRNVLAQNYE